VLSQVTLGLSLLSCHGSDPYGWVGYFYRLFQCGGPVSDLQQVSGRFEPEYVEVRRGHHCLIEVEEGSCVDCLVVLKGIIADFSEFVSVKVGCQLQ